MPEIRYKLERRIEKLTEEKLVIVRKESIEVDPNPTAVKAVLTNLGKKEDRWNFKDGVAVSTDDPLVKLLKEIGQKKDPLPRDEDISEFIDHKVNNG